MSILLQAYIGALPLLFGSLYLLIKKKKICVPAIMFAVQIVFCSAIIAANEPKGINDISDVDVVELYNSYSEMLNGDINAASELLAEAFSDAADQVEITLAKARGYVLEGSWEAAIVLYEKVMEVNDNLLAKEEIDLVDKFKKGEVLSAKELSYQSTNIHYLKEQGLNPSEFGFKDLTDEQIESNVAFLDEFQKDILPGIIKKETLEMQNTYPILADIDEINDTVAQVMSNSHNTFVGIPYVDPTEEGSDNMGYEDEIIGGEDDFFSPDSSGTDAVVSDKLKEQNEALEEYKEKYPELFEEDKYLEAYIYSEVLVDEKLDEILEEGGADEYEIISNMYVSGIIDETDFSEDFAGEYKEVYEEVVNQCQEVAIELSKQGDISDVYIEGESISEIVNEISQQDNFALQQMADDMEESIEDGVVEDDELSEFYMTLVTVAGATGDEDGAKEFFNEAVNNSEESSNTELAEVLGTIQDAYEDGGDDLDYVQAASDVSDVYQNSFHYDIVSEEVAADVEGTVGSAISETLARVSIGKIDVSKFPEISATVQYSGDVPLTEDIITLVDCGIEIEEYTLTSKEYDASKVILLCDVSGSMDNSVDQLKDAVIRYLNTMSGTEQVNIVLFSTGIDLESGFSSNKDELIAFAESEIYIRGGTTICQATEVCLNQFVNENAANTLIVMTDGEDNEPFSDEQIDSILGGLANKNNVTVYTIGLGTNIYPDFLKKIASAGGGEFLYCSDESILESAYQFIHERISNEYIITFSAEDLDSLTRTMEITIDDGNMTTPAKDTKTYSLKSEVTEEDPNVVVEKELPKGITINGLDINQLDKSTERQIVNIKGSGFAGVDVTNVYLESTDGDFNCKIKEVTDEKISFQIAPSVSEGVYSVYVTVAGKKYKVDRLVIGSRKETELIFGAYKFEASEIDVSDEGATLSGNVVLNDYLYFTGTVYLMGNVDKDSSVVLSTDSPAYVYHDTANYSVLDRIILPDSTSTKAFDFISVPIHDDLKNYNNYEGYTVEAPALNSLSVVELGFISLEDNMTYVYPDRIEIVSGLGFMKDNVVTDLLTNTVDFFQVEDGDFNLSAEVETKSRLMKEGPFTYFNVDFEAGIEGLGFDIADFMSLEGKAAFKVMFDTYNREFEVGLTLSTDGEAKTIKNSSTTVAGKGDAGITIGIKGDENEPVRRYGDKFLNIEIALPLEITIMAGPVPVTLNNFKGSLENFNVTEALDNLGAGLSLSGAIKNFAGKKEGADLKFSASADLVSTKMLPAPLQKTIKKWLGDDLSLITVEDITGGIGINYPHLQASAKANVLGVIDIAEIEMELGAISYPSYIAEMLNIDDGHKHYGFTFNTWLGAKFDWELVGANMGGTIGAVVTVDDFLASIYVKAEAGLKGKVMIFGTGFDLSGELTTEAAFGLKKDDSDWKASIAVVASAEGKANIKLFGFNIIEEEVSTRQVLLQDSY